MRTRTPTTEITVDPDLPTIRISREFEAPPPAVFRAHTDADLLVRWWGLAEDDMRIDHHDCRTGGSYRHEFGRGEDAFAFFGSFHEVRPDALIVQTQTFEPEPDGVALERLMFEDVGDGRTRLVSISLAESLEVRDAIIAMGMDQGVHESYARLDALLASDPIGGDESRAASSSRPPPPTGDDRT